MLQNTAIYQDQKAGEAVILTRVSSKDQETGHSIEAQKHRLEPYCLREKLKVIKVFEIVESSTKQDRKKFTHMIAYVEKLSSTQGKPIAIVVDKIDRLQRSFREFPMLDDLLRDGKIELHFVAQNQVIRKNSSSMERQLWSHGILMAQSVTDAISDNAKRNIEYKTSKGEWSWPAPVGYLNIRNENDDGDIILDPDRAPLVEKLFKKYSTGAHTLGEMVTYSREIGLKNGRRQQKPLGKSQIHAIMNNPFYHGRMRIKGHEYPHRYERLVSKELFDRCQSVLKGWRKKPFKYAGKNFVFRGLITCATSGRVVTANTKKKTYANGTVGQWTYLRCWSPDTPEKIMWVREERILEQVDEVLRSIQIPPETLCQIGKYVCEAEKSERDFILRQQQSLHKEHEQLQERLDKLMDLLLDDVIGKEDFDLKKQQIKNARDDVEHRLATHAKADDGFQHSMNSFLQWVSKLHRRFQGSNNEQKRRFLNFVFENLQMKGATLCYDLKKPFDLMVECSKNDKWHPVRDSNPCCRRERAVS